MVGRGLASLTGTIKIHNSQTKEAKIQWIIFLNLLRENNCPNLEYNTYSGKLSFKAKGKEVFPDEYSLSRTPTLRKGAKKHLGRVSVCGTCECVHVCAVDTPVYSHVEAMCLEENTCLPL